MEIINVTREELKNHVEAVHRDGDYQCDKCDFAAVMGEELKSHVKVVHWVVYFLMFRQFYFCMTSGFCASLFSTRSPIFFHQDPPIDVQNHHFGHVGGIEGSVSVSRSCLQPSHVFLHLHHVPDVQKLLCLCQEFSSTMSQFFLIYIILADKIFTCDECGNIFSRYVILPIN